MISCAKVYDDIEMVESIATFTVQVDNQHGLFLQA